VVCGFVDYGLWFVCGLWYRKMNVVGPSRRDIVKGKAWNGREICFIGTTYLQMIHEILASPTQCAVQVQNQQELRSCGDGGPHPPRRLKNNRASSCQPRMATDVSKAMPPLQLHSGESFVSRVESSGRFRQPRFAAVRGRCRRCRRCGRSHRWHSLQYPGSPECDFF
jgi:hypothetical protein